MWDCKYEELSGRIDVSVYYIRSSLTEKILRSLGCLTQRQILVWKN